MGDVGPGVDVPPDRKDLDLLLGTLVPAGGAEEVPEPKRKPLRPPVPPGQSRMQASTHLSPERGGGLRARQLR